MVVRFYSSTARETTLSSTITAGATSITVGSVLGFPTSTPYTLALSYETVTEELVQVNMAAGTNLTVVRGIDGTSATTHTAGARVRHVTSARDSADSREHENSNQGIHGLAPGDVLVGQTATQTLTNKTLTAPVINTPVVTDPTVTGTQSGNLTYAGESTYTGTRAIRINNAPDVSPITTTHSFQIGADASNNIRMDGNEIMAVTNGVASNLILNADGGSASVFGAVAVDDMANTLEVRGIVSANNVQVGRTAATASAVATKADSDATNRFQLRADGLHEWGAGAVAPDTNLFRGAANQLRTNDALVVDGAITHQGFLLLPSQAGRNLISFTNQTSNTTPVTFPIPFASVPHISVNITSGAGNTARWGVRAITVSTTGFEIFVFSGDSPATPQTWSGVIVDWIATQ